jgi:hypothetical protein
MQNKEANAALALGRKESSQQLRNKIYCVIPIDLINETV